MTPDSSATVFRATTSGFAPRLFSAPTGGGPRVTLSPTLVAGGNVMLFQLAADGSRAFFTADAITDEHQMLYTVPVDGSAAAVVVHDSTYEVDTFQTAGARVVALLRREVFFSTTWRVATSALDGSDDQVLLEVLDPASAPAFGLTPNGTTVLTRAANEIRNHPAAGGASRLIYAGPAVLAGFSPSGNLVRLFDNGYRVMSIHGGDTQLMLENGVLPSSGLGKAFQWRTDRLWFYRGSRDVPGVIEFYSGRLERYRLR